MTSSATTVSTSLTPFLVVKNSPNALEFYKKSFDAAVLEKYESENGGISAKLSIQGATFFMGEEEAEFDNHSPEKFGGSPVRLVLIVSNPDRMFANALNAGATQLCPVTVEESWKIGKLKDPFGHIWEIGHPL